MLYFILLMFTIYFTVKFVEKKFSETDFGAIMQSGELIVTGKDTVDIRLKHQPNETSVHFEDVCEAIPCDPRDFDFLEYELHYIHHHFVLRITWDVSRVRTIHWSASR